MSGTLDRIPLAEVENLAQLFATRVRRSPEAIGFRHYDQASEQWVDISWSAMADAVAHWQAAFKAESLSPGDRVALMIGNGPAWVKYEQAAIGMGYIVVPMYTNDRPENVAYIIEDASVRVLLIDNAEQWQNLKDCCRGLSSLQRIISLEKIEDNDDPRLIHIDDWLPDATQRYPLAELRVHGSTLATIVYTSGTTGKPKGVMLSHHNIAWNADAALDHIDVYKEDQFLSFLPLSHMFERTVGYYLVMLTGSTINYARSIEKLAEDLVTIRPTILVTVPRIFERVYNKIKIGLEAKPAFARKLFHAAVNIGWARFRYQQGKAKWQPKLLLWPILYALVGRKIMAKLGGRMRLAVSGGAPLAMDIARTFIGLGLTITQGYGLTESSPIISANKLDDNEPDSVGVALRDVEVKLGENNELLIRSPGVMLGYWHNDEATKAAVDADGWLHTGDKVTIKNEHIYITGRLKEILVMSNGEKVPPADIEMAISKDPLFDQVMVIGEQRPFLAAIIVFNPEEWEKLAGKLGLDASEENLNSDKVKEEVKTRIQSHMGGFPGYAKIYRTYNTLEAWTIDNDLMTPTLKLKRQPIMEKYAREIDKLYEGH